MFAAKSINQVETHGATQAISTHPNSGICLEVFPPRNTGPRKCGALPVAVILLFSACKKESNETVHYGSKAGKYSGGYNPETVSKAPKSNYEIVGENWFGPSEAIK